MPSTYPPNNPLEWPPSPSGSHAELMTVIPIPPEKENPVQPSVTRISRFEAECGHGLITVGSQEEWVGMMQQRCAELGSDAWVMRERALKAEKKLKQMKNEVQEINHVMRTIRTSLRETELRCVTKDRALNSAQRSIDMLELERNQLKKDAVRSNRLLAWYRSKKNQEAIPKQIMNRPYSMQVEAIAHIKCDAGKHGTSPLSRTVIMTKAHKRREKEKDYTNMAERTREQTIVDTTPLNTQDGGIVTTTPIRIRTTEPTVQTFTSVVDMKAHEEERIDKPRNDPTTAMEEVKDELKRHEDRFNELLLATGAANGQELLQYFSELQGLKKLQDEHKELLASFGVLSSKGLRECLSNYQRMVDKQTRELEALKTQCLDLIK